MEIILQTLSIIVGLGGLMYGMLKFMLRDMHKDMMRLEKEHEIGRLRTDHLYEMLCTMIGDKKRT